MTLFSPHCVEMIVRSGDWMWWNMLYQTVRREAQLGRMDKRKQREEKARVMGIGGGRWRRVVFASRLPLGSNFSHLGERQREEMRGRFLAEQKREINEDKAGRRQRKRRWKRQKRRTEGGVLQEVQELISCIICWSVGAADAIRLTCRRRADSHYHKLPSSHNDTRLVFSQPSSLHGNIKKIINIFLYVSGGVMVIHKVSQMYIKKNPLSSSLNEKYIQFPHTITLLRKTKKTPKKTETCREEEKMMWQQWGEVPPNSCKQISTMKDVFQRCRRSAEPLSLHPSVSLVFVFFPSPLSSTIWLSLMSIAHVPPSFFAPPKRKEKPIPSYVVQPTAPLQ